MIITVAAVLIACISFLHYLILVLNQSFFSLQLLLLGINLTHIYFSRRFLIDNFNTEASPISKSRGVLALVAVFFLTCYFVLFGSKYGAWDAWAIWNMHAKFLYQPAFWHNLFSDSLAYSHTDYPFMLPSVIAYLWSSLGHTSPLIPALFSYGILIAIPLLVYYSLDSQANRFYAYLSLVIFVVDNNYKDLAISQCADTLLSLFILLAIVQYKSLKRTADNRIYVLGFICAACGWVKNEGLAFYLIFTLAFLISNYKNFQSLKKYVIGSIIPILIIASFKLFVSPANDLISAGNKNLYSLVPAVTDISRYLAILKFATITLVTSYWWGVILISVVAVLTPKSFLSLPFVVLVLLLAVYFGIYLITPYDLVWHLSTSLGRLFQHVYPALIYLLLLSLKPFNISVLFSQAGETE